MTAQEALKKLKEGNKNYCSDNKNVVTNKTIRANHVSGQSPFAIALSCADSRVLPEAVFDCDLGDLFVVRVAGNIANTSSIASIEYAVAHLGTKLIVVLGHESCGAVGAALAGGDNGYNLNHLCAHIAPAVASAGSTEVADVVKENAKLNAFELINRSTIISNAVKNDGVKIVSGYYNFASGEVDFLD